jgi:hypothetical protein
MRRNTNFSCVLLGVLSFFILSVSSTLRCEAQPLGSLRQNYDPRTKSSIDKMQRLLIVGDLEEAQKQLNRIVNGVGYIYPLAKIYYQLAQNDTDVEVLAKRYISIIDHWPNSAWAQKAVVELTPLILMSDGELCKQDESVIWNNQDKLLAAAQDAAELGDNPQDLIADVYLQLLHLAHFRIDSIRVNALTQQIPSRAETYRDQIELAAAYSLLRNEKIGLKEKSRAAFEQWLNKYKESNFRPLALYALFLSAETGAQVDKAWSRLVEEYYDSIEAVYARSNL